jgi:cytochrome c553
MRFNSPSYTLLIALAAATALPFLVHCNSTAEEAEASEDDVVGVSNALGLGVRYNQKTGTLQATLKQPLAEGETLKVRLRAGKITETSQKQLDCSELPAIGDRSAPAFEGAKVVYQGGTVDAHLFELLKLYDDPNWATGDVSAAQKERAKNPDPIVEACVVKGNVVKGKIQVNLAYAFDTGLGDAAELRVKNQGLTLQASDGGLAAGDAGSGANLARITEDTVSSQIEYGELCENELGEIPFFPKISDRKYETFDCRTLMANGKDDNSPHAIPGVEGSKIPAMVNDREVETCSPGRELGPESSDYSCLDKADHGMYLARGGTQPGPMVVTAKNAQGSHFVLLCRKVADDGKGMMNTKRFTDMAMIGHNPKTGRTCFFQNSIGSGKDGSRVPHPGDVDRSTTVWSASVQSYCSGSCHGADPFVHSRWIDGAKRPNGTPIVPRKGMHADFPISALDAPYNIVAADHLGFSLPKLLVSEGAGACTNCHGLAGIRSLGDFTEWSTGTGEEYYSKITDFGKKFSESHWMPLNLEGITEQNFTASKYGIALKHIKRCNDNNTDPACEWADSIRGSHNNPKIR